MAAPALEDPMIERLDAASRLLSSALDQYLYVCLDIQDNFAGEATFNGGNSTHLANRLSNELNVFNSYHAKAQRAKLAISRARNQSTSLVPIHRLPIEILRRIFQEVVHWEQGFAYGSHYPHQPKFSFPKYPDLISHVCSHWRTIVIATPEFWTRITFAWWPELDQTSAMRTEAYLNRAGWLPLHIHHAIPKDHCELLDGWLGLVSATTPRASIIEIELDAECNTADDGAPSGTLSSIITICLYGCVPGTLKWMVIQALNSHLFPAGHGLLEPSGELGPNYSLSFAFHIQEACWEPIDTLILAGLYPHWDSPAYHGLVELRLRQAPQPEQHPTISELQLSTILASSPKLQILEFNIPITEEPSAVPVRLEDLNMVITGSRGLLRLLAPGSRALTLSITKYAHLTINAQEVNDFITRARVTVLCVNSWDNYAEIVEMLTSAPHVRILYLKHSTHFVDTVVPPTNVRLNTLALLYNSTLHLQSLSEFVDKLQVQDLVLSRNHKVYMNNTLVLDGILGVVHNEVGFRYLLEMCPSVQVQSNPSLLA